MAFGSLADFVTTAERGSYMGIMNTFPLSAPALGPVFGGLIAQHAGWRWIFWFLAIFGGVVVVMIILAMPETNRKIVGNGSVRAPKWDRAVFDKLVAPAASRSNAENADADGSTLQTHKQTLRDIIPNPFKCVVILFEKDVAAILLTMALFYAGFYAVLTSLPNLFSEIYGFSEQIVGICFIPFGVGAMATSFITGTSSRVLMHTLHPPLTD
jgi:predicted MFS family arabinose efflux permease